MNRYILRASSLIFLFLLIPFLALAQAKQPTLSNKVVRLAYVNHSGLRQQYATFQNTHNRSRQDWQSSQQAFNLDQEQLEKAIQIELQQDNSNGGKNQEALKQKAQVDRLALRQRYDQKWKKLKQDHLAALQAHEKQIIIKIGEVVAEGGFTEVKPLAKETPRKDGTDVTDLILKKLN